MAKVAVPGYETIDIPVWVVDLPSFLRWVHSGDLPEKPAVHFINGEVWVDFHMEEMNSHNQVKAAIHGDLRQLIRKEKLGVYYPDGMRLTLEDADLSCEPDGMFFSRVTLAAGSVTFRGSESTGSHLTEVIGTPDLVIEIVSPSSEEKDTERLMTSYHLAGVAEYWLIDCRDEAIQFDIFKLAAKGFTATRKTAGWVRSTVLGRQFKLTRLADVSGVADYQLEHR